MRTTQTTRRAAPAATTYTRPARTQDYLRQCRHTGFPPSHATFGDCPRWSLTAELAAICEPLAKRVAADKAPGRFLPRVEKLCDAVHALVSEAAALVARSAAQDRTRRLGPEDRGRSIRMMVDLAQRPTAPQILAKHLKADTWVGLLIELATPYDEPLAALVANAYPPNHIDLRGLPSVAERLTEQLCEVDVAARELGKCCDAADRFAEQFPAGPPDPAAQAQAEADAARAELARLGIEV